MLDKIKESVSDVLNGGTGQSGDKTTPGAVAEVQSPAASDGPEAESTPEPESNLFECPSCESVFVAIEKDTCASCRTPVEQIE